MLVGRVGIHGRMARGGRRGSTILVVLALLSILILLALTLAYTSRIEVISSHNFGRGVQNSTAARTGVAFASSAVFEELSTGPVGNYQLGKLNRSQESDGSTTLSQSASSVSRFGSSQSAYVDSATRTVNSPDRPVTVLDTDDPRRGMVGQAHTTTAGLPAVMTDSAHVVFQDASARLNLNTATEDQLERLFRFVAREKQIDRGDPAALARAIVDHRYGPDGAPGQRGVDDDASESFALNAQKDQATLGLATKASSQLQRPSARTTTIQTCAAPDAQARQENVKLLQSGVDDPEEYVADLRRPPFGDDRRFQAVGELRTLPGASPELIAAVEPFLTTFSVVVPEFQAQQKSHALLDLNRATAEQIYEALSLVYGEEKEPNLLRQFAANIVDSRDEDRLPTRLRSEDGSEDILGFERTPVISEVYADALTDDRAGDDGQYVEIYNPWPEAISLTGWKLAVGSSRHSLTGTLAPRGFLIVTDDFDNARDPKGDEDLDGQGSLYDIFGIVQNSSTRRILEIPELDIPHRGARQRVELLDGNGDLVDLFVFNATQATGGQSSFQRRNVLVREVSVQKATPFALAPTDPEAAAVAEAIRSLPLDSPFVTPLELFNVFAGYPGSGESRWAFPLLTTPEARSTVAAGSANNPLLLDARVLDLFTVEASDRRELAEIVKDQKDSDGDERLSRALDPYKGEVEVNVLPSGNGGVLTEETRRVEAKMWARFAEAPVGQRFGRVNINTAPLPVLIAVGFSEDQAKELIERRRQLEAQARESNGTGLLYTRLSDLLADESILAGSGRQQRCEKLETFAPLFHSLSVGTRAFLVEGQGLEFSESQRLGKEGSKMRAVVAMDKARPEVVTWRLAP